jgi:tripartite-type tricarboxylate transporter receptor subunit TctC
MASLNRSKALPQVPTIAEQGLQGFEAVSWYALMAPAGTPAAVADRIHADVQKALQSPAVRERMIAVGGQVIPGSRAMLASMLHAERLRYANLVREAHIKPD